jgi:peptide/nickel transport system substrate-binding protein
MARKFVFLLSMVLLLIAPATLGMAQPSGLPVDVPRNELFIEDQIYRFGGGGIGNYNLWSTGDTPFRHALMMETLWYRDQETGQRLYGAAVSDPEYNADYTQMTVHLRPDIYWSDGVLFSADDLVFTVQTLMANPSLTGSGWSAQLNQFVDTVEKVDENTVLFKFKVPDARFHSLFETNWNGVYMMPKHVVEKVAAADLATWKFENPVVLGAYVPTQFDPNGFWELYERRDDWQKTPTGMVVNNEGPKYVLTIFYGDSSKKAIAMARGDLDVFFDADYEAFQSVLDSTPTARSWYKDFPWAYPNENNTRQFVFDPETDPIYGMKDVRWALALSLNMVQMETDYIGGVAKVSTIPIAPVASLNKLYLDPLEPWLEDLQIEIEPGTMYKPYDTSIPDQIAAWAEAQGYTVPGTPKEVFGNGWWKFAPDVAERLLVKNGFKRDADGKWLKPDGTAWTMDLQSPPDENDAFRMATAASDMWSAFGIDVNLESMDRDQWNQNNEVGQFDVSTPWSSFANADGDGWPQIQGLHPKYYVPNGTSTTAGGTIYRLNDPKVGEMIDAMAAVTPDSAENQAMMIDFLKYWTENMVFINAISFKKFVTWNERYWTGFPTSEHPDYMPLYWFQGGTFAVQSLKPITQ